MFQFRQFPAYTYEFSICSMDMTPCGFPHSEIRGSKIICISPRLIAAYRVFDRLPVPRHSPCALFSLTVLFQILHLPTSRSYEIVDFINLNLFLVVFWFQYSVFKVHRRSTSRPVCGCSLCREWWAQVDSNHRPHAYQACALTT